jgi:hypothetical protein
MSGAVRSPWLLLLMVSLTLTGGCFGRFPLTRAIYNANASVGGDVGSDRTQAKLAQTAVMWVFVIIPVYSVGMIGDALVFNAIEFWTGNRCGSARPKPRARPSHNTRPFRSRWSKVSR